MAKVKLGAIVVDMRGKLGGHVFAQNRGGNYVRTKTTPTNPQTTAQSVVRVLFAAISSGWSALTQAGRDSFDSLVASYAKTNVFGDLKNPTGKALYQRLNQNLAISGQALIAECVNPMALTGVSSLVIEGFVSTQGLDVSYQGNLVGQKVIVYATPPMSAGTKFVKNKLRQISVAAGANNGSVSFGSAYVAKFGAFAMGNNVVVGVRTINANGQATPMQTLPVDILATP